MNAEKLKALVSASPHAIPASSVGGGESEMMWLPVIRVKENSGTLGLTSEGDWVAQATDGPLDRLSSLALPALPILEISPDQFREYLLDSLSAKLLPPDVAETFPIIPVLVSAMRSESLYWQRLVLNWANRFEPEEILMDALSGLAENGLSQTVRHQAAKTLKRLHEVFESEGAS